MSWYQHKTFGDVTAYLAFKRGFEQGNWSLNTQDEDEGNSTLKARVFGKELASLSCTGLRNSILANKD